MEKEVKIKINLGIVGVFLCFLAIAEIWIFCGIGHLLPNEWWPMFPFVVTSFVFWIATVVFGIVCMVEEWAD